MGEERRGVVLYGSGVDVVAEALQELDPRYVPADRGASGPGQVPVLCCPSGAEADAVREAAPDVAWLVVELYRTGVDVGRARDPMLFLNVSRVGARAAARAIGQPDVLVWYEVINPVRVVTIDGGPVADDYSNVRFVMPDGHRRVAHAVGAEGVRPECLSGDADMVLPSHDLWALSRSGEIEMEEIEMCQVCILRHG